MQVKDVIKMLQNSYPDQEEEIIVAYWDKVLIQEDKNTPISQELWDYIVIETDYWDHEETRYAIRDLIDGLEESFN